MARAREITENEYIELKKQVLRDVEEYKIKDATPADRIKIASERIKELSFNNDEMEKIYVANILMPDDDEFQKDYYECDKTTNIYSERYKVPQGFVYARVFEINKYGKYLKTGEKDMESFVEIINEEPGAISTDVDGEHTVEADTAKALAKINTLFLENDSKTETIGKQEDTIESLNTKVSELEEKNTAQSKEIDAKNEQIKKLETVVTEQLAEIKYLLKYKEAYEKIMDSLNKTSMKK